MTGPSDHKNGQSTTKLRKQAESRVSLSPADASNMPAEEIERLLYELEIHREELQIQNEELRQTQYELRMSRDHFADLYDFAPVGYLTIEANSTIVEANLTAATMLDRARSELVGTRLSLHCDQPSRLRLNEYIETVSASQTRQSCELQFLKADGSDLDVRLDSTRIPNSSDDDWNCRVVMTDITRRVKAERQAIANDRCLTSVTNSLNVLISYVDADSRVRFLNAAHEEWFYLSPLAPEGHPIQDVMGEEFARIFELHKESAFSGREAVFESSLIHKDKGRRDVMMTLVPDVSATGTVCGVHCLCADITDRKIVDEQNSRRFAISQRVARLTPGERGAYALIIKGHPNKYVALKLDISLRTAERRRRKVLDKLGVETLPELLQLLADIQQVDASQLPLTGDNGEDATR